MKVAIAGAGNVGSYIAADLKADHEVLLIEQDPEVADRIRGARDVTVVEGDACEPVLLE